jgi:hypothetical protein
MAVKGNIFGAVIWQQEAIVLPLSMCFCLSLREEPENVIYEDVEEHIIHFP